MTEMEIYRKEIDEIDRQFQQLFERRMEVAGKIGAYKASRGLPVFDAKREESKIAELKERASTQEYAEGIAKLYDTIFTISRNKQEALRTDEEA
ncbi:MAG: chorismate mutase [Lachnospiraceae bacterium]|nr:chorismate mutase [Lachnospiraceae bacterium]